MILDLFDIEEISDYLENCLVSANLLVSSVGNADGLECSVGYENTTFSMLKDALILQ